MSQWHLFANLFANLFDWVILALIAICIAVWPTQLISDSLNRWLRIGAIGSALLQVLIAGVRLPLMPVYLVALLFAVLLVADRKVKDEPSIVRESKESALKKAVRWTLILGCAAAWLTAAVLCVLFPRLE